MFTLVDSFGSPVLMKNGTPFSYSNKELAGLGKRFLEADRKATFKVVKL